MNLRDLKYLVAVQDSGSFLKASKICNVSQPTLSGQIKKLEVYLGNKIFERTTKSIKTTEFGEAIISKARRINEISDDITAFSIQNLNPWSLPLKLGIIPTLGPYLIPKFFTFLKKEKPKSKIFFDESVTSDLTEKLSRGELDAIFLATDFPKDKFDSIDLFKEPFWVAFHKNSVLNNLTNISTTDLKKEKMLLLHDGHCLRDQALKLCSPEILNSNTNIDTRATSLETLINIVAAGEGFTLIPALALKTSWSKELSLSTRKLDDRNAFRKISLVFRKNFSKKQMLKELCKMIVNQSPSSVELL